MIPLVLIAALLASAPAAGAKPAGDAPRGELVWGKLPADPARAVVQAKCLICHSSEYVAQQRLTGRQWQATVEKMRKFGAPLTDDEAKQVSAYLGRNFTPDLPDRRPKPVSAPDGSLPPR